jgi:hypothetical protein
MLSHIYTRTRRAAASVTTANEPEMPLKRQDLYLRRGRRRHHKGSTMRALAGACAINAIDSYFNRARTGGSIAVTGAPPAKAAEPTA